MFIRIDSVASHRRNPLIHAATPCPFLFRPARCVYFENGPFLTGIHASRISLSLPSARIINNVIWCCELRSPANSHIARGLHRASRPPLSLDIRRLPAQYSRHRELRYSDRYLSMRSHTHCPHKSPWHLSITSRGVPSYKRYQGFKRTASECRLTTGMGCRCLAVV